MNLRRICLFFACSLLGELLAVTVTFHGGAGQVGGSCATVERKGFKLLVDCGTAYGDVDDSAGRGKAECGFPFKPGDYADLLLTHAHQDHAGRVPELFNAGFTGTVWVTEATRELLAVSWKSQVLYDTCSMRDWRWTSQGKKPGVRVHWRKDCEWSQKIAKAHLGTFHGVFADLQKHLGMTPLASKYAVACTTCQELELKTMMDHVKTVRFGEPFHLGPLTLTYSPTKHLPGASSICIEDGVSSCIISGDLGSLRSHLVKTIEPARKADAVFIESTYGDASHGTAEADERDYARFREVVGKTVRANGVAWIPAFALDRSQRVLLEIQRGMAEGTIPSETPIHFLSPSSRDFTALYAEHPEWFDVPDVATLGPLLKKAKRSFNPGSKLKAGAILITTSGMMDTGFSLRYVPDLLPRASTTVCLVGYQAPGTCGHQLQQLTSSKLDPGGTRSVKVRNAGEVREIPVAASVHVFHCFSGHGDARENDAWLANNRDSRIFLVHGDMKSMQERAEGLRKRFGCKVEIVEADKPYALTK